MTNEVKEMSVAKKCTEFSQQQKQAVWQLEEAMKDCNKEKMEDVLWETMILFAGYPFQTAKMLEFTYTIKGNEIFVDRKEKSITRATVNIAFHKALELGKAATGPKKLGTFGASYLYPVFRELGVIS